MVIVIAIGSAKASVAACHPLSLVLCRADYSKKRWLSCSAIRMPPTIIAGNITDDPDLCSTQGGQSVANFTVASTRRGCPTGQNNGWKDGKTNFLC